MSVKLETLVIGSGAGGLASAICLAAQGRKVRLFESQDRLGGKLGIVDLDGVEADTGPSVLTLPHILEPLFQMAGTSLEQELKIFRHDLSTRFHFADGKTLELRADILSSTEEIRSVLGEEAAKEFAGFMTYAKRVWDTASPHFIWRPMPNFKEMMQLGKEAGGNMLHLDPFRSMARAMR